MIKNYYVYSRQNDITPIVSLNKLPAFQMKSKLKWVGKKAKMEAIFRHSNVRLSSTLSTQQVNDYITENLFKTPLWHSYHQIFQVVANETEVISEKYVLLYTIIVDFDDTLNECQLEDERLIQLLTCELLGQSQEECDGLVNPIKSIKRIYDNV